MGPLGWFEHSIRLSSPGQEGRDIKYRSFGNIRGDTARAWEIAVDLCVGLLKFRQKRGTKGRRRWPRDFRQSAPLPSSLA